MSDQTVTARTDADQTGRDQTGRDVDVDVVVIGSGGAGLCAALTASEHGATRILVAESEAVVGGSSRLSGGLVMGAGTRYQRALGIDDDADALVHDYMAVNRWSVDAAIVRRLCELYGWDVSMRPRSDTNGAIASIRFS